MKISIIRLYNQIGVPEGAGDKVYQYADGVVVARCRYEWFSVGLFVMN